MNTYTNHASTSYATHNKPTAFSLSCEQASELGLRRSPSFVFAPVYPLWGFPFHRL